MSIEIKSQKFFSLIKKTWDFLWNGDSFFSWVSFMLLAFILIKFVFFPTLSLITGSKLPIVIVESCSMYHGADFNIWWEKNKDSYGKINISKQNFESFKLENGFSKGDIFFVTGSKEEDIQVGEVIIFTSGNSQRPIIHRVVAKNPIQTKGDNNYLQFTYDNNYEHIDETNISQEKIVGNVIGFKIPFLGWLKLIFFEPFRSEQERGLCHSKESFK